MLQPAYQTLRLYYPVLITAALSEISTADRASLPTCSSSKVFWLYLFFLFLIEPVHLFLHIYKRVMILIEKTLNL